MHCCYSPAMAAHIPTFTLYGEQLDWPTPDLLHWESVAQRSRLHNWRIRPHRHSKLLQVIYVQHGHVRAQLDDSNRQLSPPCLIVIPPLCVHGFEFSPDVEGHVLTLGAPLLRQLDQQLASQPAVFQEARVYESGDISEGEELSAVFAAIAGEYTRRAVYRDWAMQVAVSRLLLWLLRQPQNIQNDEHTGDHADRRVQKGPHYLAQFNQLIEQHFREHLPLAEYASAVGISVPHLNAVCRELVNRSALQLVHARLLLEAKRNLVYTVMTVADISNSLGFSEPAYFTRFFKRLAGVSPQAFRNVQSADNL